MTENPLLRRAFVVPFDEIRPEHVEPAIDALIAQADAAIGAIEGAEPTYGQTLGALDHATEPLDYAMGVVGHLESVATSDPLRAAYNAVQPKVSAFYSGIPLRAGLWQALKRFRDADEARSLPPTKRRFLDKTIDEFRRHGAELDEAGKARLSEIDVELAQLTTKFGENVLDATAAFELWIDDEAGLAGLPQSARDAARQSAEHKQRPGWRFTLSGPSYIAVMTYLDDASVRERVYRAYNTRATGTERDNRPLLADIVRLRAKKATLLGYATFADLVLEDRMAKTGDAARTFIDDLRTKSKAAFVHENETLQGFRRTLEGPDAPALQPWDVAYYAEKQRRAEYDFDPEALRPYLALPRIVDGLFAVASRLYGVTIEPADDMPVWHESVTCHRVRDASGEVLAAFYVDTFPRETKRDGAWMNGLITALPGEPHLGLICANVTPPVGDQPALLTHREVETLFHEFGHLMHHCLSRVEVRSLGGTHVAWDFVELPSQIMENWCWEREALDLFARHYETDAPIPDSLLRPMVAARTYRAANSMMRQIGFASVDLALHTRYEPKRDGDLVAFARTILAEHAATALPDDYAMVASFGHLFAHPVGYAAGYYSYKWAEVLDADAFTRFAAEGIFSAEVGDAFRRTILQNGDSRDPMQLYRDFMGREPKVEPLLARSGLAV